MPAKQNAKLRGGEEASVQTELRLQYPNPGRQNLEWIPKFSSDHLRRGADAGKRGVASLQEGRQSLGDIMRKSPPVARASHWKYTPRPAK